MAKLSLLPAAIDALSRRVEQEIAPIVIADVAAAVADQAAREAPRASGTLANSITAERRSSKRYVVGPEAGVFSPSGDLPEVYGEEIEMENPFLVPAVEASGRHFEEALRAQLREL